VGDANPASIVTDLLTNVATAPGFPAANLDTRRLDRRFRDVLPGGAAAMSLLLDRQQPARLARGSPNSPSRRWCGRGSLLKVIPYGDQTLSNNGATWDRPT